MLFSKTSVATAAVAGASFALAANPDKPEMNPGWDYGKVENGLRNNLHPTHSWVDYWGAGWIPEGCKSIAESHGLNSNDFTIFNVHYDDCTEGWTFCRHKNAGASEIDMIDMFGRAPVHMRQFIRHPIATPGLNDGAAAFIYNSGDVVFESAPNLATVIHEMSHSLDWHARTDQASPFSSTGNWQNEYAKDTNTVTGYGRTNWMENFAESGVVGVFDKNVPGGLGGVSSNWNQIFHQYATYQGWYDQWIHPGGTCAKRFSNSETVQKSAAKSAKFVVGPKPKTAITNSNITIIEHTGPLEKIVCSDHGH